MKRSLALIIAVFLLVTVFSGCGSDDKKDSSSKTETATSTVSTSASETASGTSSGAVTSVPDDVKSHTINGVSLDKFRIVRPHYKSSYITQIQIEALQKAVKDNMGIELKVVEDAYETEADYEIVIGNTNRSGNMEIGNRDQYNIGVTDKKVYINGGHNYSTAIAVSEFTKALMAGSLTSDSSFSGLYSETIKNYDLSKYYYPTFYDDFDGNAVDTTKWRLMGGTEGSSKGKNGKTSLRSNDPARCGVGDGCFYIYAGQDDQYYYGGMLITDRTMYYRYGYMEMTQLLPDGPGFWIATWTVGDNLDGNALNSPEIDVNEMFGNSAVVASNCHSWPTTLGKEQFGLVHTSLDGKTYGTAKKRYSLDNRNFSQDFHTFGYLWDETHCAFTCDGEIYFDYDITEKPEDTECFTHCQQVKVSMATGFDNCSQDITKATPEQWRDSNKFLTDNFYIYQLDDGKHLLKMKT